MVLNKPIKVLKLKPKDILSFIKNKQRYIMIDCNTLFTLDPDKFQPDDIYGDIINQDVIINLINITNIKHVLLFPEFSFHQFEG